MRSGSGDCSRGGIAVGGESVAAGGFFNLDAEGEGGLAGLAAAAWFAVFMLFPFFNRDALRAGEIAGAGLDVFENEPQVHPGLCALPNVLLVPHKGAATMDGFRNMGRSSAEKIFDALDGKLPANCLNPEARQASN